MSLKTWLARNISSPSQYAVSYTSGLLELIDYLAASLVVFSGQRPSNEAKGVPVVFEDHFQMELSGFRPVSTDITDFVEPSAANVKKEAVFARAYLDSTAFLSLYSDNRARNYMRPENAESFVKSLHTSVAKATAGKNGLDPEPRNNFMVLQALIPTFLCKRMLNEDSFGVDDGLGNILQHLSRSTDGKTQHAFVVGSQKQSVGCAAAYVRVLTNISDNIKRCAQDVRW